MPRAFVLHLAPTRDAWWERPDAYRALGYALLALGDSALAGRVHDSVGRKPFTLAVSSGLESVRVRVCALDDATEAALLAAVARLSQGEPLTLGSLTLRVESCVTDDPPYAQAATYDALAQTPFPSRVALDFLTPTAFSQGPRPDLPLPVPERLLLGWGSCWNRFAPPSLHFDDTLLETLAPRLALSRLRIETQVARKKSSLQIGFVGSVTLEARETAAAPWPDRERRAFATLTAYSPYCGSGVGTTQGLGLTLLAANPE